MPNSGSINYQLKIGEPGRVYAKFLSTYAPSFSFEYPGKAGTYIVIVRIKDQASYGYYDTYATLEITIT